MKQTGITVAVAMMVVLSSSAASANTTGALTAYQINNTSMLQSLQSGRGFSTTMHTSGRRLKSASGSAGIVAAGQSMLDALSLRRQQRVQTAARTSGIEVSQQQALARLAAAMPQPATEFRAYFDRTNNTPTFIKFNSKSPSLALRGSKDQIAEASSRSFLQDYKNLLKITHPDEELTLARKHRDELGQQHFRYQQMVDGVPLWGSELMLHLRQDNSAYLLNGRFHPSFKLDTTPELSAAQAEERVRQELGVTSTYRISSELVIYPVPQTNPRLAYQVDVLTDMASRWLYFIDAHNGKLLHRIDYRQQAAVNASGLNEFGSTVSFTAWQDGANYFMIDTEVPTPGTSADPVANAPASGDTVILDARNGEGEQLYYATSNAPTSGWDATAVTAMENTIKVYEYYRDTFGRNSVDNAGKNLITVIHFGTDYNNAFWNGELMVYGDGDGQIFNSLARCRDVNAHELTHGVVQATAGLKYENQSGALNEAYADIFAVMVDRDDWTMGEDCTVAAPGYLRNLANPAQGFSPQPVKMSEYQNLPNTEQGDNGGVHVNNSIPAHAAYLMAEGLTSKALGTSIGRAKTEQIFYRALTTYLTASSQFIDARNATLQAAEDLYGASSAETTAVAQAWDIVEVSEGAIPPADTTPTDSDPVTGDDLMLYVYSDTNEFNHLYAQIMTDPLVYSSATDIALNNAVSANPEVRPAAYTSATESVVFYVGEDENIYEIDIAALGTGATPSTPISTLGGFWSIALAPDGRYFAFTSTTPNDNNIYVWDLLNTTANSYSITPADYSEGDGQLSTASVLYADAIAFDYTGRYITFDALNCISTEASQCNNGGGYRYWSIGVMDASDGSIFYPVSSQSPDIDIGFPSFAQNNNYVIAVDVVDYSLDVNNPSSRVMALNFETQQATLLHDFGSDSTTHFAVPTFWGDDLAVTLLMPASDTETYAIRKLLNTSGDTRWEAANATSDTINEYSVKMPLMHRAGLRSSTGNVTPASSQVNFGAVNLGAQGVSSLTLNNTGNSDVNITNIQLSGNDFIHNGTNMLLRRGGSVTWALSFSPSAAGAKTANLTITTDAAVSTVNVLLSGTAVDPTSTGGGNTPDDSSSGGGFIGLWMLWSGLLLWMLRQYRGSYLLR